MAVLPPVGAGSAGSRYMELPGPRTGPPRKLVPAPPQVWGCCHSVVCRHGPRAPGQTCFTSIQEREVCEGGNDGGAGAVWIQGSGSGGPAALRGRARTQPRLSLAGDAGCGVALPGPGGHLAQGPRAWTGRSQSERGPCQVTSCLLLPPPPHPGSPGPQGPDLSRVFVIPRRAVCTHACVPSLHPDRPRQPSGDEGRRQDTVWRIRC